MEDEQAVMVNLYRVTNSLLAGRVTEKTAALVLWSASIVAPGLRSRVIARNRNVSARNRRDKPKIFETQRNRGSGGKNNLPRMNADARGSENQQLANSNWRIAKQKAKTFETQRNGVSGGRKKMSRELTRKIANQNESHSGVTNGKSFRFGMAHGRTPGAKVRGSDFCENSLNRHGHDEHSRDLSTPPRVADASSESLKRTRGGERGARLQRGVFRNESAESGDRRIGTSAHRDTGVSGKPLNMSVDGKSGVVDNSGQTGAAPYKPKGVKADDRPRKLPVCGAVNSNGRRTR